jgi:predicted dehydrogenase
MADSEVVSPLRWGVLGTARIAVTKVIPAMQQCRYGQVTAIASRDPEKARAAADRLGLPKAFSSFEQLLADVDIDAVYIPLPNHMHVPWSIRSLRAGKHVLCEKPVGMNAADANTLLTESARHPSLKVMEAFMYRFHPQWRRAHELVALREIGELRTIATFFSYSNIDPADIRNRADAGGGALMDIGCYGISLARFLFGREPERVLGWMEHDPHFRTDRLTSAVLDFGAGTATFTCGTQLVRHQRVDIVGTNGRIEIEIPFNAPPDRNCRIWHQRDTDIHEIQFDICDQYTIQGDLFSRAVLDDSPVPTPLADAVANMRVIDAVVRSAREGEWCSARDT